MSELSSRERALLETAREDWGPSECAPVPSASQIEKRLADKPWLAVPMASLASPESNVGPGRLFGITAAAIGICAVALVGFVGVRKIESAPQPAAATPAITTVAVPALEPAETSASAVPSVAIDSLPDAPAHAGAPKKSREAKSPPERAAPEESAPADVLGEEIALIRAAQGHLRAGAPDRALGSLSTHASRFPRGVLRDERMALQVLALCERGDADAARAVKSELERSSPSSSHLQRLASSCAR